MEDAIVARAGLSLAKMTVDPYVTSAAHRHPNCTEAIHLLSGTVQQRSGDEWIVMEAGDTVLVHEGTIHQTRNIGTKTAVVMSAYSSGARIEEAAS